MGTRERLHILFSQAQAGDRRAFEELAEYHSGLLFGIIRRRFGEHLGSEADCDDVYQESLLRAFGSIGQIEWKGESALLGWLGGIAENVILAHARRQKRGRQVPIDSRLAGAGTTPSTLLQRESRFVRLQAALDSLSPEARQVVLLARIEGLKLKEVAERVGRSPEAVRMLLRRSVQKLKEHFGDTKSYHLPKERRLVSKEDRDGDA